MLLLTNNCYNIKEIENLIGNKMIDFNKEI